MSTAPPPKPTWPRRSTAWFVLAALVILVIVREFRTSPPAQAVYCDEAAAPAAQQVTMLTATWCRYCTKARNWLVARGVSYCEYDIERSATGAARYAASRLQAIPQIFVADRLIVGFDERELERALEAQDLLPVPDLKGE